MIRIRRFYRRGNAPLCVFDDIGPGGWLQEGMETGRSSLWMLLAEFLDKLGRERILSVSGDREEGFVVVYEDAQLAGIYWTGVR